MSRRVGLGMIVGVCVAALSTAGCQLLQRDNASGSGTGSSRAAQSYEAAIAPFAGTPPSWSGTWLVESRGRRPVAWRIDGSSVTVSDGRARRHYRLTVTAPCQLRLTDLDDSTSSRWAFSFRGGVLRIGPGHVGLLGDAGSLLVCSPNAVVTRRRGGAHASRGRGSASGASPARCTRWRARRGELVSCALRHDGTRPVFETSRSALAVTVQGKLLLDDAMRDSRARRVPNLAVAERLLRQSAPSTRGRPGA